MTNTFRKHHKTIMWIIIVGTIVTFVYYLTPNATRNQGGGGGTAPPVGAIDGEPISQPQFEASLREAKIAIFIRQGRWPNSQEAIQALPNIAFQQLFIAAKIKELNLEIPVDAATLYTRKLFGVPASQPFPKDEFEKFVKTRLEEQGKVTSDDFYQYVRDQVGVELLVKLYGMNGDLITAKEAEFFFRRYHESMTVQMVRFPLTNYTALVVPTPQDIQDFYTKRQAAYSLPDREQINYIQFNVTNYLPIADKIMAGISNLDQQIDQTYLSKDASAYKDADGKQMTAEVAKAKMKEVFRMSKAAGVLVGGGVFA